MKLGGNVCIRNGNTLDFCWRECIKSLLPVCDVVSVCDGESDDGTQEEIREWMKSEPKIVLCVYPWPNPKGNADFWVEWMDYNRQHVKADYQLQLDADEILDERSYDEVRRLKDRQGRFSVIFDRLNFWKDHRHLIPEGHCLGKHVIRMAPQDMFLASDGYHPKGVYAPQIAIGSKIRIFHYGFIRDRESFFKKEKLLQEYFFNSHDPRIMEAEKFDGNWMEYPNVNDWWNRLVPYDGPHPAVAHEWLRKHGYEP